MNFTLRITGWLRAARLGLPRPPGKRVAVRDRRRTAAVSLSVAVAGVILLNLGLSLAAESSLYIRDPGYSDKEIRLARQEALNPTGPRIVMLGTSRTAAAFHAGRMREQLGSGVVFNFGIPASGPITHSVYLKRLLHDGHKPDLLILEVLPPTLGDLPAGPTTPAGPLEGRFFFGDRMTRSELDSVVQYGFPERVKEQWRRSVIVPWYALRFPILGRVMPSALPWQLRFDWSRGCDDFGWGAPFADSVTPLEYELGLQRAVNEYSGVLRHMHPTGGGSRALADIAELCRREGIPLTLVMMPEANEFRAIYQPEVLGRVRAFLAEVCREHGCTLIDAREWLPDSGFSDGHHMVKPGAAQFTDRLSEVVVKPFLTGRR